MNASTIVVGAGISGLACAGALARAGRDAIVLERSRGLGGRCATRRIEGQPVDHGVAFLHGSDPAFLEALADVDPAEPLAGWPRRVQGEGPPCLPRAFGPGETRLAYASGITVFPKALARGLDVRRQAAVTSFQDIRGGVAVELGDGPPVLARDVVLAVPAPTARRFLTPLMARDRGTRAAGALLDSVGSQACLTVLIGYSLAGPAPPWDVLYPSDSDVVQTISHDSAKRAVKSFRVFVVQARPSWSRARLEEDEAVWSGALLREAGRLLRGRAEEPSFVVAHRWRFARTDGGTALSRPLLLRRPGGGRIVVTGEAFTPGGGIEGAWLAGLAAARRLVAEE